MPPIWLTVIAWIWISLAFSTSGVIAFDIFGRGYRQQMGVMDAVYPITATAVPEMAMASAHRTSWSDRVRTDRSRSGGLRSRHGLDGRDGRDIRQPPRRPATDATGPSGRIELPLRLLIWNDGEHTILGYEDPRDLAG